jgi:tripartite-type tricarboxylate transporter receptor subunit TctC
MKRIAAFLAAASTSLVLATTPLAQSAFPVRTVKIIVPFPGGGINDVLARILADKLAIKWSQPVVIENKTGPAATSVPSWPTRQSPMAITVVRGSAWRA